VLMVFVIGFMASSCGSESKSNNKSKKDTTSVIPIEAAAVSLGDITANYNTTATLEAEGEANVVAKVSGIIKKLYVEEGDKVRQGQALAKLEDEQYVYEVKRIEANLKRLLNDYQRNKELYDKKLISAETYDNIKFQYEAEKANLDLAKLQVAYCTIRAPIEGVVSERMIKTGNMVSTNQIVFRVTDFSPLWAILYVPEHEMSKIRLHQPADLVADAIPDKTFTGVIERISPVVDPSTGTFKVTVIVNDKTGTLKPGMFVRIKITHDTHKNTLMIPKSALLSEDGTNSVYVINNNMSFKREIELGYASDSHIEVIRGLKEGDSVVTIGQSSLKDSTLIEVINMSRKK
jgi:membrane fusion protein (multidrug efflux system)